VIGLNLLPRPPAKIIAFNYQSIIFRVYNSQIILSLNYIINSKVFILNS